MSECDITMGLYRNLKEKNNMWRDTWSLYERWISWDTEANGKIWFKL